jgi:starch synthase
MPKKFSIAHIASEVAPFSKTGGLADVTRSLPKALRRLGHEVIIITPLYEQLVDKKKFNLRLERADIEVLVNDKESVKVNFWKGYLMEGLPVYFVENKKYFSKSKQLYGSSHENARFMLFDLAALQLLELLSFKADIIHCHDWHAGLVPYLLKTDSRYSKILKKAKTIFTIHNLAFQLGHNWWEIPVPDRDYGRKALPDFFDPALENINFAKRAIMSADIINTVSEQYRAEIMTKKFGQDLHRILRNRQDYLYGIINGIDYNTYNPAHDSDLYKKYNSKKIHLKADNKRYLQEHLGLPVNVKIPLFCTTSRVTYQKGFGLILKILPVLLKNDLQLVFMGDGDKEYIKGIKKLVKRYPKKIIWQPFNAKQETLIYAAADFFLLPSHYEPCGINQLIAMRYGCIPIVHEVGGLYDTVSNYNPATHSGTGFTFKHEDDFSLYEAVIRALEDYRHKESWRRLVIKAMEVSSSWEIPAKKYVKLYRKALKKT